MVATSFLHVSDTELSLGIAYAKAKCDITLHAETLRMLCNATGAHMRSNKLHMYQARYEVLSKNLRQSNPEERARRNAYSAAIGKIFSERSRLSRLRNGAPKKTRKKKTEDTSFAVGPNGQLEWTF